MKSSHGNSSQFKKVRSSNMQSIIQSIKKNWCDLIFSGKKINELRKSKPKDINFPITVYVYETKSSGGAGAIIGSYECRSITAVEPSQSLVAASCVSMGDIVAYKGTGKLYAWDVHNPARYDVPKPLSDFGLNVAPQSWGYIEERMDTDG